MWIPIRTLSSLLVCPGEVLHDGIIFDSKWERQQSKQGTNFCYGQVSEEILANPPPAECPSNVLVVPERPNAGFICPVTAESKLFLYLSPERFQSRLAAGTHSSIIAPQNHQVVAEVLQRRGE